MTNKEAVDFGKMWIDMNKDSKDSNTYEFFELAVSTLSQSQIPDNATNGDVIKALFPKSETIYMLRNILKEDVIKIENEAFLVDEHWWNAPYKGKK